MEGSSIVLNASNQRQRIFPTFYHCLDNEIKAYKGACVCLREFSGLSDSKIKPTNLLALALASHINVFWRFRHLVIMCVSKCGSIDDQCWWPGCPNLPQNALLKFSAPPMTLVHRNLSVHCNKGSKLQNQNWTLQTGTTNCHLFCSKIFWINWYSRSVCWFLLSWTSLLC